MSATQGTQRETQSASWSQLWLSLTAGPSGSTGFPHKWQIKDGTDRWSHTVPYRLNSQALGVLSTDLVDARNPQMK